MQRTPGRYTVHDAILDPCNDVCLLPYCLFAQELESYGTPFKKETVKEESSVVDSWTRGPESKEWTFYPL